MFRVICTWSDLTKDCICQFGPNETTEAIIRVSKCIDRVDII